METIAALKKNISELSKIKSQATKSQFLSVYSQQLKEVRESFCLSHKRFNQAKKLLPNSVAESLQKLLTSVQQGALKLGKCLGDDVDNLSKRECNKCLEEINQASLPLEADIINEWRQFISDLRRSYESMLNLAEALPLGDKRGMKDALRKLCEWENKVPEADSDAASVKSLLSSLKKFSKEIHLEDEEIKSFLEQARGDGAPVAALLNETKIKKFIDKHKLSSAFLIKFKG